MRTAAEGHKLKQSGLLLLLPTHSRWGSVVICGPCFSRGAAAISLIADPTAHSMQLVQGVRPLLVLLAVLTGHGSLVPIQHDVAGWICKVTLQCTLPCKSLTDIPPATKITASQHPQLVKLPTDWAHILLRCLYTQNARYASGPAPCAWHFARVLGSCFAFTAQLTASPYRSFRDEQATNSHCLSTPTSACEATR